MHMKLSEIDVIYRFFSIQSYFFLFMFFVDVTWGLRCYTCNNDSPSTELFMKRDLRYRSIKPDTCQWLDCEDSDFCVVSSI